MRSSKAATSNDWTLGRIAAVFVALAAALVTIVSGPTPALAADSTCSGPSFAGVNWGGTYYCNYGFAHSLLLDGTLQIYVVAGADYNVFTRWRNPQGALGSWVNMGGNVKHNGDSSYLRSVTNAYSTYNDEVVRVIGLDGNAWCNIRSGRTGSWSGWSRDHCEHSF